MRFRVLGEFHKHRGIYLWFLFAWCSMAGTNVLNIWASAAASQPSPATDSAASRLLGNGSSNDTAQPAILWEAFAARRRSVSRQLRVGDDIASSPFAPFPAGWDSNLSNTVTTWKQHCQTYFTQMRVCSCCGVTELGAKTSTICGKLRPRDQPIVPHDLLMQAAETPLPMSDTPDACTLEQALFPYLFVFAQGAWDGGMNLCNYLRMRMSQLFSPFTLCKNYLLLMYHVRQTHRLVTDCAEATLQRYITKYKRDHPDATEQQVMSNTLKHAVSHTVPGSPAYFRNKLKDLLAMVYAWGLPGFFLTLTADEHSDLRWSEIKDLEEMLHRFNESYTYGDAPVECAALFMRRLDDFMKLHIVGKQGGLLGTVKHYVIRFELYKLVTQKQTHVCRDTMCCANSPTCKYGFPYDPQPSHSPVFDSAHNRFLYHRLRYQDRNVSSYHPNVLLLWGAHMNLQRITQSAWSFYVLKYSMKCEPSGCLQLQPTALSMLGLDNLQPAQLATASALLMTKPVSPAEAALMCLQHSVVQASSTVQYINYAPPDLRRRAMLRHGQLAAHPIDKYCARPTSLESHTFSSFYLTRPTPEHAYLVPLPSIVTQGALHAAMPHPPSTDIEFGQSELPDSDMASPDQLLASLARDLRRNPPPPAPGRTFKFSPKQLKALRMGRATPEEMAACRSQDDTSRLFDTLDLRRRHFKAAHDGEDRANGTQIMLLTKWGELYDEEDMTYKEANRIMTGHLPGIRWFEVTTLMEDHGVSIDTIYSLKDLTRDQGEALVKRFTDRKRTASQIEGSSNDSNMASSSQTSTATAVAAATPKTGRGAKANKQN
ncbi:TPA: hypothetical protein ACH3X1_015999 [Trebouxia sp. C0004]